MTACPELLPHARTLTPDPVWSESTMKEGLPNSLHSTTSSLCQVSLTPCTRNSQTLEPSSNSNRDWEPVPSPGSEGFARVLGRGDPKADFQEPSKVVGLPVCFFESTITSATILCCLKLLRFVKFLNIALHITDISVVTLFQIGMKEGSSHFKAWD